MPEPAANPPSDAIEAPSAPPRPAISAPSTQRTSVLPPVPVTQGPMRARPVSGGTLRVLDDGRTVVAADADRDQVYVVDLIAGKVTGTVALDNGDEPGRVVEDAAGLVHVALRGGGALATIDPVKGALVARRALCPAPRGLAFEKDTNELHVACAGGELVSIDATPTVTAPARVLTLERDLRDVVVSTNGRLMVSTFRSADVYTVSGDGAVSSPHSPSPIPFGGAETTGDVPGVAWRMVSRPDGSGLLLHELARSAALGVSPGAYDRQSACGDAIVTSTVTVVAPDGTGSTTASQPLMGPLVAADLAMAPNGSQIAVVSIAGDDPMSRVQLFDISDSGGPVAVNCWPQSAGPSGAPADDPGGDGLPRPAPYLPGNGEIVAVAYDPRGNIIVQSREPATVQILTQRREAIELSTDSRFDLGHQLFHTATRAQIACVSCHPEGGEDGRVWQFLDLGPRRTQSLRGGIMDTAPFHWGGDEPDMPALINDVFVGRMSGDAVDSQRAAALVAWLDQIPTIPVTHRADAATVARGRALFASTGCVACHAGNDFTNGQTVDVGTGGSFQVPQLHGLGGHAPYMHDGCAATLRDRFSASCGGDARHGVGVLTDVQVTDLVGYLETL